MASAAAVALFLLVSTPVRDVNQEAYTASFVPTGMVVQKPVLLEAVLPDSTVAEADTKQESSEEVIAREVKKVVSVPAPEKKAFVSRPVVVQSKKMYHIVIASFPSESQADEFIAGVDLTNVSMSARLFVTGSIVSMRISLIIAKLRNLIWQLSVPIRNIRMRGYLLAVDL